MPKGSLDAIIAGLGAILIAALQRERQRLAEAMEEFAIRCANGFPTPAERPSGSRYARGFQEMMHGVDAQPD